MDAEQNKRRPQYQRDDIHEALALSAVVSTYVLLNDERLLMTRVRTSFAGARGQKRFPR